MKLFLLVSKRSFPLANRLLYRQRRVLHNYTSTLGSSPLKCRCYCAAPSLALPVEQRDEGDTFRSRLIVNSKKKELFRTFWKHLRHMYVSDVRGIG